ncbi:MAG: WD40 repeat domain-containing protein [Anaerolineae bacterium]|nr:WD40 repeat domain-containing protein [Anaerolineae bacterium]
MSTRTLIALLLVLTLAAGLNAALPQPDPPRLQVPQGTSTLTPSPTDSDIEDRRIRSMSWSSDGSKIAFSRQDGLTFIQDAATGQYLQSLQTDLDGPTAAVAFSTDAASSKFATGGADGVVRIWNVGEDKPFLELPPLGIFLIGLEWSPVNPDWLALVTYAGPLQVWDTRRNQLVFNERGGESLDMDWSPDGTKLVITDGVAFVIWDVTTRTRLSIQRSREFINDGLLSSVDWSPNDNLLVSGANVGAMRTWDGTTGALVTTFSTTATDYTSPVSIVRFSPDGSLIARIGNDGNIRIYSTAGSLLKAISTAEPLYAAAWSPDGSRLAYGGDTDGITIVSVDALPAPTATPLPVPVTLSPTPVTPTPQPLASIDVIAWSPDDTRLVYSETTGTVTMLNRVTGEVIGPVIGHFSEITALAWRPQWDEFVSVDAYGSVKIWGGTQLGVIAQIGNRETGPINCVEWNPDGTKLAIGTANGEVIGLDANLSSMFYKTDGNPSPVYAVKWVSNNQVLKLTGDFGYAIQNVDLDQYPPWRDVLRFTRSAAFNKTGDRVVIINNLFNMTGVQPSSLEVWNLVTAQMLYSQPIPGKEILSVNWSPDGAFIATGSTNGADIWNAVDGTWIETLAAGYRVSAVAWSSDGSQLAYGGINGLTIVPAPSMASATPTPQPQ